MKKHLFSTLFTVFLVSISILPYSALSTEVAVLFKQELPDIAGKTGLMLTVEYEPGESSAAHRHNANTFVYVLEGAVVMQVQGGEEKTLTAGQTFYETPNDIHSVSKNASATEPAKILVFFIKESGAPVTMPVE